MNKIIVSFKDNEKEKELYNEVLNHSSISGYIKDLIKQDIKEKEQKK